MILIVGGQYQRKRRFAEEHFAVDPESWVDGESCTEEDLYTASAICNLHLFIRRRIEEGREVSNLVAELIRRNPSAILLCNEIGCGIVPADAKDRAWRDAVGFCCQELAAAAEEVYRVICGIASCIKGERKGWPG